jgi:hypothetical protein
MATTKNKRIAVSTTRTKTVTENKTRNLSPARSTLITSRREGESQTFSLYESEDEQFLVHVESKGDERITPVTCTCAARILGEQTRRHMSRIFRRKLEVPAITTIDSKNFDTTKDELVWSNCDDGVEAVAVYRTAAGREYLRLVSAWHDLIVQFRKSDWDRIQETLAEWTMYDWTFATIFDPECGCYPTDMSWGNVNEGDGPAPWPAA